MLDAGFTYNEPIVKEVTSIEEFLNLSTGMPRLVFCSPAHSGHNGLLSQEVVEAGRPDEGILVSSETVLTNLQNMQPGALVVHGNEEWMRGIDYNTEHPDGIALLIAKPCSSAISDRFALSGSARPNPERCPVSLQ